MITFTSNVIVDDDATATDRFNTLFGSSSIVLKLDTKQAFDTFSEQSSVVYPMTFKGSGVRDAYLKLKQVEALRVINGEPRFTLDGYADAVCFTQGELVTFSMVVYNQGQGSLSETISKTGIITKLNFNNQTAPNNQSLDLIFYLCDRLWVRKSAGVVTSLTRVGA